MVQPVVDELSKVAMAPALQASLMRARDYASQQGHLQVMLEHLLLALTEDEDAAVVLQVCRIDLGRLRNDIASFIGAEIERTPDGSPSDPRISAGLTQILKYATLAARQGRRPRIDGAIVLAAIVGEGRSMSAAFLKAQGLTFEEAIKALQQATQPAARKSMAPLSELGPPPSLAERPQLPAPVSAGPPDAEPQITAPQTAGSAPVQTAPHASAVPRGVAGGDAEQILAQARARIGSRLQDPGAGLPRILQREPQSSDATHHPDVVPSEDRPDEQAQAGPIAAAPPPADLRHFNGPEASGMPQNASTARSLGPPPSFDAEAAGGLPSVASRQLAGAPQGQTLPATSPATGPGPAVPSAPGAEQIDSEEAAATAGQTPAKIAGRTNGSPGPSSWAPPPLPAMPRPPQAGVPPPVRPPQSMQPSPVPRSPPPTGPVPADSRAPRATADPGSVPWSNSAPQTSQDWRGVPGGPPPDARHMPPPGPPGNPLGAPPQARPPQRPDGRVSDARQPGPGPRGYSSDPRPRGPAVEATQVSHNVPGRMRAARPRSVEVRVARSALIGTAAEGAADTRVEAVAARAISVRLRPQKNAFQVEAQSPETQWDFVRPGGMLAGEVAVWRFVLTPRRPGRGEVTLQVIARVVGADGIHMETALPDQVIEIRSSRDVVGTIRRAGMFMLAGAGSIVAYELIRQVLRVDLLAAIKKLIGL